MGSYSCCDSLIIVVIGGEYPWYVFRGHPVPTLSESDQSTVKYEVCPTPKVLYEVFKKFYPKEIPDVSDPKSRQLFVNAQWALGGAGTGAPVSVHPMSRTLPRNERSMLDVNRYISITRLGVL